MGRPDFIDPGKEKLYGSTLSFIDRWNDKAIPKDERALQLILHADALIDILNGAEGIEAVLRAAGRDPDSVKADIRAALKGMHLNSRMDHYATLLLFPNATQAAIKKRFKTLMLFYHPDRQTCGDPDDLPVAKRITDAYNTLKDSGRKEEYARNLVHRAFSITRSYGEKHRRTDPRYLVTRIIIPSIAVFCILLAAAFLLTGENKEKYLLEAALSAKSGADRSLKEADSRQAAGTLTGPHALPDKQTAAVPKAAPAQPATPVEKKVRAGNAPPRSPIRPEPEVRFPVRTASVMSNTPSSGTVRSVPPAAPAVMEKTAPEKAERAVENQGPASAPKKRDEAKAPVVQAVQAAPPAYERDAAAFVKQYAAAYEEGDLRSFIGLYSPSVVENGKLGYDAVKKVYARNFENMRYKYDLRNMRSEHKGEYLSVSGTYQITKLTGPDRKPIQGEITWTLKREDGTLKIVKVDATRTRDEAKGQATPPAYERDAAAFVKQYAAAYEEGDLTRFIGLYSPSVVENGKLGYDAVKKAYARNFENSRYKYELQNVRSDHKGEYLRISGTYHLTKLTGPDRKAVRGDITWTLKREEGDLKIVRVDYRRF